MTIAVNHNLSNCKKALNCNSLRWSHTHFIFPQFTSFHSVFHSFHGLMNSVNWPASSIWVFIAQAGRALQRANAEATGSNPIEAPKSFFGGAFLQLFKLQFTATVTYSFHLYSRSSHHFILCFLFYRFYN